MPFIGRLAAYGAATTTDEMAAALARNLYRGAAVDDRSRALAAYVISARTALAHALPDEMDFGPLPIL